MSDIAVGVLKLNPYRFDSFVSHLANVFVFKRRKGTYKAPTDSKYQDKITLTSLCNVNVACFLMV